MPTRLKTMCYVPYRMGLFRGLPLFGDIGRRASGAGKDMARLGPASLGRRSLAHLLIGFCRVLREEAGIATDQGEL